MISIIKGFLKAFLITGIAALIGEYAVQLGFISEFLQGAICGIICANAVHYYFDQEGKSQEFKYE